MWGVLPPNFRSFGMIYEQIKIFFGKNMKRAKETTTKMKRLNVYEV